MSSDFDKLNPFGYILSIRCTSPLLDKINKEGSMDDKEEFAREQAREFLIEECGYQNSYEVTQNNITDRGLGRYLRRLWKESTRLGEGKAVSFVAGKIDIKRCENCGWFDLPDDKPTAHLILDECGVKTYEVDGEGLVHVESYASATYGRVYNITIESEMHTHVKDDASTAKEALEQLGYEVKE